MRYTALFLIALVGLSLAAKQEFQTPADRVLGKIDELVTASRNEQAEQTRMYVVQQARCKSEIEYRNKEIADGQVAAGSADQQFQICNAEKPVAQAAKKQSTAELAATQEQLRSLELEHNLYQQVNLARQQEHQEAINNIQGAYNIIGNFANGKDALNNKGVFVQVSQKINSVLKTAIKHKFHSSMVPVLSALVQMTQSHPTTVSTSALQRVVNLLRNLEANIKNSEVARENEWKEYQATYARNKQLLQQQVEGLTRIIGEFKTYLQSLNTCLKTEQNILKLAQQKVSRNVNILDATTEMCNAYDVKYKLQTQQRSDYVALLSTLRQFVVSALSEFKNGLYSRGDFVNTLQVKQN